MSLLTELHLTNGLEGYDSMDLSRLSMLTKLIVDNCEFVQLDRTILPKGLRSLSLLTWYGLKEHYVLAELRQGSPSAPDAERINRYTERSQASEFVDCKIASLIIWGNLTSN